MPLKFQMYKQRIDTYLLEYLAAKSSSLEQHNPWQKDVYDRLSHFIVSGKTIRGGLVLWCADVFNRSGESDYIHLAASIELLHAGLLIHDDIMDRDETRRGNKALYVQYRDIDGKNGSFGDAMAICAGDLAFFSGYDVLSRVNTKLHFVLRDMSREYASVCIAQMQDVAFSHISDIPSPEEVLSMYTYKTAKYTFSFPMKTGVLLSGGSQDLQDSISKLGEVMGLVFQLTDDQLNLFGDPKVTGKPTGSDLREKKKTYAYVSLMQSLSQTEHDKLAALQDADSQTEYMYELMDRKHTSTHVESYIQTLSDSVSAQIQSLPLGAQYTGDLLEVLSFLQHRSS